MSGVTELADQFWHSLGTGPMNVECFGDGIYVIQAASAPSDNIMSDAVDIINAGKGAKDYVQNLIVWVRSVNGIPGRVAYW